MRLRQWRPVWRPLLQRWSFESQLFQACPTIDLTTLGQGGWAQDPQAGLSARTEA
jgi:hypothetical protein